MMSNDVTGYFVGSSEEFYESLENADPWEAIQKIYARMENDEAYGLSGEKKSEENSHKLRLLGNFQFKKENFGHAMKYYNLAILHAPKSSRTLALAYSNRSVIFLNFEQYEAALKDIEICFKLNCPVNVVTKLIARKKQCFRHIRPEDPDMSIYDTFDSCFPLDLLQMSVERNPEIPCASKAVGVDVDGSHPTVVAVEKIRAGALVALEDAFISLPQDNWNSCYYCLKMSLNLIPCDECCISMFCDEDCKKRCVEEYHEIECKILTTDDKYRDRLFWKSVIKTKNEFGNWKEYIQAVEKNCSIVTNDISMKEIFDNTSKFTLLHTTTDYPVDYGKKFVVSIGAAIFIRRLLDTVFFPTDFEERQRAIHATAKHYMFLNMNIQANTIMQTTLDVKSDMEQPCQQYGIYSFIGKLKHSCNPNLMVMGLNNKAFLVALRTIEKGTELTVSHLNHHFVVFHHNRSFYMHEALRSVCLCELCTELWGKEHPQKNYKLTESQKEYLAKNDLEDYEDFDEIDHICFYRTVCDGLDLFRNLQYTDVYIKIFQAFLSSLYEFQFQETNNITFIDQ